MVESQNRLFEPIQTDANVIGTRGSKPVAPQAATILTLTGVEVAEYCENEVLTKNGEKRYIAWHNIAQRDPVGNVVGTLSSGQDVTARRELEKQALHLQRLEAVGQLTGGVAHDFNNILTVMLGNAEWLKDYLDDHEEAQDCAEQMMRAVSLGASLTQRLLAFSRQQPLQPVSSNVNGLIASLLDMLGRTLGETVNLTAELDPNAWPAMVDPSQLEHVLVNLSLNARDAMPEGGTLAIETRNVSPEPEELRRLEEPLSGEFLRISVCDTGTGMSREVQGKVFEPFFTTKGVGEGSGLGLSMAYGFVRQSKGHIAIDSEPGSGTTFRVYLPRSEEAVHRTDRTRTPRRLNRGRERILVVEDDATVRMVSVRVLLAQGYEVVEATAGAEALGLLDDAKPFDLLFTDVVLPGGMNGVMLAEQVQQLQPGIRVLFASGYTAHAEIVPRQFEPCASLLNKPYRRAELLKLVKAIFEPPEAVQAKGRQVWRRGALGTAATAVA